MSILELNLNDVPDAVIIEAGEAQLRITGVEEKTNVNNKPYLGVTLESVDNPEADLVFHNIYLPDGENARKDDNKRRMIAEFAEGFKIPISKKGGIDTDNFIGATGFVKIKHREWQGQLQAEIEKVLSQK